MKFEIYKDKRKEWRWRLKARNNKIIAVSEGYKLKSSAKRSILKMWKDILLYGNVPIIKEIK